MNACDQIILLTGAFLKRYEIVPLDMLCLRYKLNLHTCIHVVASLVQVVTISPTGGLLTTPISSGYSPVSRPSEDDMDKSDEFYLTVVLLSCLALLVCIILGYIMCCRRNSRPYRVSDE